MTSRCSSRFIELSATCAQTDHFREKEMNQLVGRVARMLTVLMFVLGTVSALTFTTPTSVSAATPREKCDWIADNFPQTTAEVQALGAAIAGVEKERINTVPLRCDPKSAESVFQGFTVLGPNEGYGGDVTISPWEHGAVDGSREECGYTYDGETTVEGDFPEECDDTIRLHDGSATGPRFTWYVWDDANEPDMDKDTYDWQAVIDGKADTDDPDTSGNVECMLATDMADKMGWTVQDEQPEGVTKYGGAVIDVTKDTTVPPGWAATNGDLQLEGGDLMTPDTYSLYPPGGECRDTLGVEA